MINIQENTWSSEFGKEYTERNIISPEELDVFYKERYGTTHTDMNRIFLNTLNLYDKNILEVGCNVGNKLRLLQKMGYRHLYGIELQYYAVEKAKSLTKNINIIQGTAEDIPYKEGFFDMVFTSGVLIHIDPLNIGKVLDEIHRCAKRYIWGIEYYADTYTEIEYRGNKNLLWKTDFAKLYLERFPNLKLIREEKFKYSNENNMDSMFLLEK